MVWRVKASGAVVVVVASGCPLWPQDVPFDISLLACSHANHSGPRWHPREVTQCPPQEWAVL